MTDFDSIWRNQDEIRTVVNAVLGALGFAACYRRDARIQVISDADEDSVLPLYMPSKKDTGNSQKWEFLRPFSSKRQVDYPF